MTLPSVLCAGRVYCDLIFTGLSKLPCLGEEVFADGVSLQAGGGAFITAATLQSLGHAASVFTTLPQAPFDTIVLRDIDRTGVDRSLCVAGAASSGPQITVAAPFGGDRAFLTHTGGRAVPQGEISAGGWAHLHIGELRTLVDHPALVAQARAAGMSVSLDCGWDAELLAQGAAMTDVVGGVDIFLPNLSEFDALLASGMGMDAAPLVVVKSGADGARAYDGADWVSAPAVATSVVDPTGAGDAFNAGFLSTWLVGGSLGEALARGNSCGAACVAEVGGTRSLQAGASGCAPVVAGHEA